MDIGRLMMIVSGGKICAVTVCKCTGLRHDKRGGAKEPRSRCDVRVQAKRLYRGLARVSPVKPIDLISIVLVSQFRLFLVTTNFSICYIEHMKAFDSSILASMHIRVYLGRGAARECLMVPKPDLMLFATIRSISRQCYSMKASSRTIGMHLAVRSLLTRNLPPQNHDRSFLASVTVSSKPEITAGSISTQIFFAIPKHFKS